MLEKKPEAFCNIYLLIQEVICGHIHRTETKPGHAIETRSGRGKGFLENETIICLYYAKILDKFNLFNFTK